MPFLPEEKLQRLGYLKQLLEEQRAYEEGGGVKKKKWREVARPNQLAPEGEWFIWLLLAGRGFGKTRAANEWVLEKARKYAGCRIALVGQTIADVRDTICEGESGLLNCLGAHELRYGTVDGGWNRSLVEIRMANKSYMKGFCVGPGTNVLTADLRYIPAGDVTAGMQLAAFEKDRSPYRRHYKTAWVESAEIIRQPCYRLILDDGTEVICSEDHLWLTRYSNKSSVQWIPAKRLRVHRGRYSNSRIIRLFDLWKTDHSFVSGYLGAAYDGEGYLTQTVDGRNGGRINLLGFNQNNNEMWDIVRKYLDEMGFLYRDNTSKPCGQMIMKSRSNLVKFLGQIRPVRLLPKFDFSKLGSISIQYDGEVRAQEVLSKEFIGEQEVVALKTTTETFIAEGLASHNSSEKPWKLRGPQFHFAYGDEACFWADASKGTITDTTWSNLLIATRLPARPSWDQEFNTQITIATTPRTVPLLRTSDPDPARAGIMQREDCVVTQGRTLENIANLSQTYQQNVIAPLIGTRLGRQELDAEILEERENALWKREWIEETRLPAGAKLDLVRVVVAVDPAVSDGEGSAETGIMVVGADRRGHGYVLGDRTVRSSPDKAMRTAIDAYHEFEADRIVAEINNGGDYIGSLLRAIDPNIPYRTVRATRGKTVRAEPVSALYEQRRCHHVGTDFIYLEDQLCSWAPTDNYSPDRLDSLVWAFYELKDLVTASWKDAYGVTSCQSCAKPFFKEINSVLRTNCPFCSAHIEDGYDK